MRILLADDDIRMRAIVQLWLENNRHEVTHAGNGMEAIERLAEQDFDVLVTDINMPLMNGLDLVNTLLERGEHPRLILILSSRCDLSELRKSFCHPAVHCCCKPFRPSELTELIENLTLATEAPS